MVSECPESISSDSNHQINGDDPVPSPPPTMSNFPTVSEMINEEAVSEDGGNQTVSENDDKQTDEHIINDVTYDYLPQGKIFTYYFLILYLYFSLYYLYLIIKALRLLWFVRRNFTILPSHQIAYYLKVPPCLSS